jgi:hypothetical protein
MIAKKEWATLDTSPAPAPKPDTWTWQQLDEQYQALVSDHREDDSGNTVYPSKETISDVRQAFACPPIAAWKQTLVVNLNEDLLDEALKVIHETQSWDAHRKARAYVQAALGWAAKHHPTESGLRGRTWWKLVAQRKRTPKEVRERAARQELLKQVKAAFKVEHLGSLLNQHEKFCLAHFGNERVSPGVRWGLWWDALTGHRRGSGTWVALEDIQWNDPRNELPGWGLAMWRPEVMKTQNEFVLPTPLGLHIMRCMMRDYQVALERVSQPKSDPLTPKINSLARRSASGPHADSHHAQFTRLHLVTPGAVISDLTVWG